MRKLAIGLGIALAVVGAIIAIRTLSFAHPSLPPSPRPEIAIDEPQAVERLAGAVRIPTISSADPAGWDRRPFDDLRAYLAAQFPLAHARLAHETVNELSLLYAWEGSDPSLPPIMLIGHQDVVPVPTESEKEWTHAPFGGEIAEGFVWGRGAMDDKATVIGTLEAVEYLLAQGFQPKRTVYLGFGHDEEVGGKNGAAAIAALLQQRGIHPEFLVDEGGGIGQGLIEHVEKPVASIAIAEKGYLTVELSTASTGGHGSMPPPHTAIGELAAAIERLESHPFPHRLTEPVAAQFAAVGPEMPIWDRIILSNLWLFEPYLIWKMSKEPHSDARIRTTTAVTMISGGTRDNVLPAGAKATVNLRILSPETTDETIARIKNAIDDPKVELRTVMAFEPTAAADVSGEPFRILQRTIGEIFPNVLIAPSLLTATTDSRHYRGVAGSSFRFLPMRSTPADLGRFHGVNERLSIQNYGEIVRFYVQLIRNAAG